MLYGRPLVEDPEVLRSINIILVALSVVYLLGKSVEVMVQSVNVVSVGHTVKGLVVPVGNLGVVAFHKAVELVKDTQFELVLYKEGQYLLNRDSVLDALLAHAYVRQDGLAVYPVPLLVGVQ